MIISRGGKKKKKLYSQQSANYGYANVPRPYEKQSDVSCLISKGRDIAERWMTNSFRSS